MSRAYTKLRRLELFQNPVELLTAEDGFGLKEATPLQHAVLLVMCGFPIPDELWDIQHVRDAFGGVRPLPGAKEICVLSGVRGGKTLLSACAAVWATQHVRLDTGAGKNIRPGEVPRMSITSYRTDLAMVAFGYIKGAMLASAPLSDLLAEEPRADSLLIKHPSGKLIEVTAVAGSRAGATLVARWSAGIIFDEAPRMTAEEEGVVNLDDMIRSTRSRMLDGAVISYIGSPWGQTGTVYNIVSKNFENPNQNIVVVRAPGSLMNPSHWTEERCEDLRVRDYDAYLTDVLAQFRDPETSQFSAATVDAATRTEPLKVPAEPNRHYVACMDPATRGNSWTLGIAETEDNRHYRVVFNCQWTGSKSEPLSPKKVFEEMKPILEEYGVQTVLTDQFAVDALRDLALDTGVLLSPITITAKIKLQMFDSLRYRFNAGLIELPPDPQIRADLLGVKRRISKDSISIILPETNDGRHCDYAAMIAMLCGSYLPESELADEQKAPDEREEAIQDEEDGSNQPREWWERDDDRSEQAHSW